MTLSIPIRHTTVEVGTAFEQHALSFLSTRMSMALRRVGGANDGGVDLRGWWYVPRETDSEWETAGRASGDGVRRLRVMAQCKAEKKSCGPRAIRELEGVMAQLYYRREQMTTEIAVAILLSQSGFSKAAMLHATQSRIPLMLLHLPGGQPVDDITVSSSPESDYGAATLKLRGTRVESAWWNRALSHGVLGGKMELRREILVGPAGLDASVGLWMDGKRAESLALQHTDDIEIQ